MSEAPQGTPRADRWKLREGLILAAYLALIAAGTVTVLLPELQDEAGADRQDGKSEQEDVPDAG